MIVGIEMIIYDKVKYFLTWLLLNVLKVKNTDDMESSRVYLLISHCVITLYV